MDALGTFFEYVNEYIHSILDCEPPRIWQIALSVEK